MSASERIRAACGASAECTKSDAGKGKGAWTCRGAAFERARNANAAAAGKAVWELELELGCEWVVPPLPGACALSGDDMDTATRVQRAPVSSATLRQRRQTWVSAMVRRASARASALAPRASKGRKASGGARVWRKMSWRSSVGRQWMGACVFIWLRTNASRKVTVASRSLSCCWGAW